LQSSYMTQQSDRPLHPGQLSVDPNNRVFDYKEQVNTTNQQ
jgi:hypothetical protein